jgi:excisionase family DNA binding protein
MSATPAANSNPAPSPAHAAGAPWSIQDAATYLTISMRHLHRLLDAGRVRSVRIGRRVLIPDAEIKRLAEHGTD